MKDLVIVVTKGDLDLKMGWNLEHSFANLPEIFFAKQNPETVSTPRLILLNNNLAKSLGLKIDESNYRFAEAIFAGNLIPPGAFPIAQGYAGHQFGHFTILGDGRALLLGEQIAPGGEKNDIQLKGSGPTAYSRGGDGRATLGPMLREYIISEAMHALGIPTTRSLAVVTTGENVLRERILPGAILTRVASSHLRIGTFQYAAFRGTKEELQILADYAIQRHYPNLENEKHKYLDFFKEVLKRQAQLIAQWQLVGFIHGVMNTDNMTISGETIDYGPCAFLDIYAPETVYSSIDKYGRYAYQNQPSIAKWNLARLAESLLPLFDEQGEDAFEIAQAALEEFDAIFKKYYLNGFRAKLGIFNAEEDDGALFTELLELLERHRADFQDIFRNLTLETSGASGLESSQDFQNWLDLWQRRLTRQKEDRFSVKELMQNSNPVLIPHNFWVEEALEAAVREQDYTKLAKLNKLLAKPYAYSEEQIKFALLPKQTDCNYQTFCGT